MKSNNLRMNTSILEFIYKPRGIEPKLSMTSNTTKQLLCNGKRTMTTHKHKVKKDLNVINMSDVLLRWAKSSKAKMEVSLVKVERYRVRSVKIELVTIATSDFSISKCVDMLNDLEDIGDDVYVATLEKFKDQD